MEIAFSNIWIIHESGITMCEVNERDVNDVLITTSFLSAIQHIFVESTGYHVKRIRLNSGDRIYFYWKKHFFVAGLTCGWARSKDAREIISKIARDFSSVYKRKIETWRGGNTSTFADFSKYVRNLIYWM